MENRNEIEKALYKQKPIAKRYMKEENFWYYDTKVIVHNVVIEVDFEVPVNDMGDNLFEKEVPAQLLRRWMV